MDNISLTSKLFHTVCLLKTSIRNLTKSVVCQARYVEYLDIILLQYVFNCEMFSEKEKHFISEIAICSISLILCMYLMHCNV